MKINITLDNRGSSLLIAIFLIISVSILSISSLTNAFLNGQISRNKQLKIKSFYAADGEMVRLSQEMHDQNRTNYFQNPDSTADSILFTLQAEDAIVRGAAIANNWGGYKGSGFVDYIHSSNDSIRWTFSTTSSGSYNALFRYALADTNPRPMKISVNGNLINNSLVFQNTGSWNKWQYVIVTITLLPGNNIVDLVANGKSGPNVDQMLIVRGGIATGSSKFGDYKVNWQIKESKSNHFEISTTALLENKQLYNAFQTDLKQMLEVGSDMLVTLSDTMKVPVTFYDFHSDRTNPEFECPFSLGVHKGMVKNTLDADRKPVLGSSPHRNYYIRYWFRPWEDAAKGNLLLPNYFDQPLFKQINIPGEWGRNDSVLRIPAYIFVGHDMAFKNVVIHDSVAFNKISEDGMHELRSSGFFMLDNRGFGNEWSWTVPYTHNYSYTMEMHTSFTKLPGQVFMFTGDDDVWLFVNDSLVMDIGGIHEPKSDTLRVDNIPGLLNGNVYNFDFFYCERHSGGSTILIQTNMLTKIPETTNRRQWKKYYGNIN